MKVIAHTMPIVVIVSPILIESNISVKGARIDLCGYRLPTPSLSLLHDITQAWEGEMGAEHQSILSCRPFKKLSPIVHSPFRQRVIRPAPVRMLYHYRVNYGIGQV